MERFRRSFYGYPPEHYMYNRYRHPYDCYDYDDCDYDGYYDHDHYLLATEGPKPSPPPSPPKPSQMIKNQLF